MKSRLMFITATIVGLAAFSAVAWAQSEGTGPNSTGGRPGLREKIVKEFDKDGDGKLNEEERAAARKAMEERREATSRPARDGEPIREAIIKKFDKDGDGKLNEEERAAARKAMEARREATSRPARDGGPIREAIIKKFDKDGDGKLNEEERAAARKAMEARRANRPARERPQR